MNKVAELQQKISDLEDEVERLQRYALNLQEAIQQIEIISNDLSYEVDIENVAENMDDCISEINEILTEAEE